MDRAEFGAACGTEDWRMLGNGLYSRYRCASLAEGARWAAEVRAAEVSAAEVATEAGPAEPSEVLDIDLRATSVTIRIPRWEEDLSDAVLALARRVQASARAAGFSAEPESLRQIQIAVAHAPGVDVEPFWRAVLGHVPLGTEDAHDPHGRIPPLWFHEVTGGARGRGRTHVDVYVPADRAEAVVAEAVAAGGRIAPASNPPHWWSLASPDNHGVDIAPWPDR